MKSFAQLDSGRFNIAWLTVEVLSLLLISFPLDRHQTYADKTNSLLGKCRRFLRSRKRGVAGPITANRDNPANISRSKAVKAKVCQSGYGEISCGEGGGDVHRA